MKSEDLNKIKTILKKYESGKTTLKEEDFLMAYFSSGDVLPELAGYQAEFNYYSAFRNMQFSESIQPARTSVQKKIRQFFSKWYVISAIVLVPVAILTLKLSGPQNEELTVRGFEADNEPVLKDLSDSTITIIIDPPTDNKNLVDDGAKPVENLVSLVPVNDSAKIFRKEKEKTINLDLSESEFDSATLEADAKTFNPDQDPDKGTSLLRPSASWKETPDEAADKGNKKIFNLTENTTTAELARIARLADKAGIEYTYIVDQHKKKIHELNIVMTIPDKGLRSQLWITVPKKGSFLETLWWTIDENGRVLSLPDDKIDHKVKARHPIDK